MDHTLPHRTEILPSGLLIFEYPDPKHDYMAYNVIGELFHKSTAGEHDAEMREKLGEVSHQVPGGEHPYEGGSFTADFIIIVRDASAGGEDEDAEDAEEE